MLEKGMHKSWKMLQKGAKIGADIEKISIKMKVPKNIELLRVLERPRVAKQASEVYGRTPRPPHPGIIFPGLGGTRGGLPEGTSQPDDPGGVGG